MSSLPAPGSRTLLTQISVTLGASPFALKEHPFSIASSAARAGAVEFSIKAVGDFTRSAMSVTQGQPAFIDGPYGAFSTDRHHRAPGYVFVAGGSGIAPIMCMLRTLADRGDRRPLLLFYGNRRQERTFFREELLVKFLAALTAVIVVGLAALFSLVHNAPGPEVTRPGLQACNAAIPDAGHGGWPGRV